MNKKLNLLLILMLLASAYVAQKSTVSLEDDSAYVKSEDLLQAYQANKYLSKYYGFKLPKAVVADSINGAQGKMLKINTVKSNPGSWTYVTFYMYLEDMWNYTARGIVEEFADKNEGASFLNGNLEVLKCGTACLNSNLTNDYKAFVYIPKAFAKYNLQDFNGAMKDIDYFITYAENNFAKKIKSPSYEYTSYRCYLWRAYYLKILILNSLSGNPNYIKLIENCNTLINVKSAEEKKNKIVATNIERNSFYFYLRGVAKVNLGNKKEGCADISSAINLGDKTALKTFKEINCE